MHFKKEINDHKDTTESVIVQTEKAIVSTKKSAKRKNKKRRGQSIVNKSTANVEDKINSQSNPESSTAEPSSSQTSSAAIDPTIELSEANQSLESSSKQSPSLTNGINNGVWPKNTVLIAGDSMLPNIDETKLSHRYHTKVRAFRGSSIEDLHDYLKPLLKKRPEKIILLIGTNDLQNKSVISSKV